MILTTIKEISETNKVGQCLARKPYFSTSYTISVNPKNQVRRSSKFLLQGGRSQEVGSKRTKHILDKRRITIETAENIVATTR